MKQVKSRVARIEARLPPQPKPSILGECLPFWTSDELEYLLTFLETTKVIPIGELARHVIRALNRKVSGMGDTTDRSVECVSAAFEFWRFALALDDRHGSGMPAYLRYDALDLTRQEVRELVQLAANAETIDEVQMAAHIIHRLRLDGVPMSVSQFADLVIHGKSTSTH